MRSAAVVAGLVTVFASVTVPCTGGPRKSAWQVVARRFGDAGAGSAATYWVGLRNTRLSDRAFCRLGIYYETQRYSGELVSTASEEHPPVTSPHPCPDESGLLVLAGQTHFVRVSVEWPADADRSKGIRFEIVAEESCLEPKCGMHHAIQAFETSAPPSDRFRREVPR